MKTLATVRSQRVPVGAFAACMLVLIAALPIVPRLIAGGPEAHGAAEIVGYSASAAHATLLLIALFTAGLFALLPAGESSDAFSLDAAAGPAARPWSPRRHAPELLLVAALALIVYFPPFLAKYGTFIEDEYFLTVLHRMQFAQAPYRDFEFQYGPLMIMPAYWFTQLFGYSMQSYYWYLALLEAVQYVLLLLMLQLFVDRRAIRIAAFVLFVGLMFNDNLGLSWNGLRRFLPVVVLSVFAVGGGSLRGLAAVSVLLGLLGAYSPEYGAACAMAIAAGFVALLARQPSWQWVRQAAGVFAGAVAVWAAACLLTLGTSFPDYLSATASLVRSRAAGEGAFAFAWSLNSLAVFTLLLGSCALVGGRLLRRRDTEMQSGDLLLICGLAYALAAMKSGLARSDMYHLVAPILGLAFALLLPLKRGLIRITPESRRAAIGLVIVIWVTYVPGLAGVGFTYLKGWVWGARDTFFGIHQDLEPVTMPGPSIAFERTHPPDFAPAIGRYLSQPTHQNRPVLYYGYAWGLDKYVGVPKTVYPTDDYLMSDDLGLQIRDTLAADPDVIVLMWLDEYEHLFRDGPMPTYPPGMLFGGTPLAPVLRYFSSTHYGAALHLERERKVKRWERTIGSFLRDHYARTESFPPIVVLERRAGQ